MKPLPGDVLPFNNVTSITERYSCHISTWTDFFRRYSHANITKHKKIVSFLHSYLWEKCGYEYVEI